MTSKNLMIETNKVKVTSFIIILATVIACCAPFVHKIYPNTENSKLISLRKSYKKGNLERAEFIKKKKEVTYFGYSNQRKLWYAIGKPIALLYFAILLMYTSFYINDKKLSLAIKQASILGVGISFYFIICFECKFIFF